MKKKNLLALLAGIPDDAEIVFERFENENVIKEIPYTNGEITRCECVRIDTTPNIDLIFHGISIDTNSLDEIDTVSMRFTE